MRRASSRSKSGQPGRRARLAPEDTAATDPTDLEEVAARAARLGVTPERVLQEYAWIAFADLSHIVKWGPEGFEVKPQDSLTEADIASISEIAGGSDGRPTRVKLYDKKAALDAIARHLGMFPPAAHRHEKDSPADPAEDAREVLARRLARLAAGGAAG